MGTIATYDLSSDEFQKYLNSVIRLVAEEMVKDGLIDDSSQVTDRYLALTIEKSVAAKMFQKLFNKNDKNDNGRIIVIRVDNKNKTLDDLDTK